MRQPYFDNSRKTWVVYVTRAKKVTLGKDKDEAFRKYHELMLNGVETKTKNTVQDIFAEFLVWTKRNRASKTYRLYKFFLDSFSKSCGVLFLYDAKPNDLTRWITKADYKDTTANTAIRSVSRAMNWAVRERLITENPFKGVSRPEALPRESYINSDEFRKIIDISRKDEQVFQLLMTMRATGCRPMEIRNVEARHFDRVGRTWTFPIKESKGKRRQRVIVLPEAVFDLCCILADRHPTGPLFRTKRGLPWKMERMNRVFKRLSKKSGVHIHPYAIRHTFATDALMRGIEPMTVATLMGHSNITMLWKVYQKIRLQSGHLSDAAKAAGSF